MEKLWYVIYIKENKRNVRDNFIFIFGVFSLLLPFFLKKRMKIYKFTEKIRRGFAKSERENREDTDISGEYYTSVWISARPRGAGYTTVCTLLLYLEFFSTFWEKPTLVRIGKKVL